MPKYKISVQKKSDQTFIRVENSKILLNSNKTDFSDVGEWKVSLKVELAKYPNALFETNFQVTIKHPCLQTSFPTLTLEDMSYQIGDPETTKEFNLPSDTFSQNLTIPYICGLPELVLDPLSQTFASLTQVRDD